MVRNVFTFLLIKTVMFRCITGEPNNLNEDCVEIQTGWPSQENLNYFSCEEKKHSSEIFSFGLSLISFSTVFKPPSSLSSIIIRPIVLIGNTTNFSTAFQKSLTAPFSQTSPLV